jgi:hypothetical protein
MLAIHIQYTGREPVPLDEILRAHAFMDAKRISATHQVAQVAMMAGRDLDHLVQGEHRVSKLLQIAASGNTIAPTATFQVVVDYVLVIWLEAATDKILEHQAKQHAPITVFRKFLAEFFLVDADAVANGSKVGVENSRLFVRPLGSVRPIHNVVYGFVGIAAFPHALCSIRGVTKL